MTNEMKNVLTIDEWGRPAELAPGTVAAYGFMYCTTLETGDTIEEAVAWIRKEFDASVQTDLADRQEYLPDLEYGMYVLIPAAKHIAFRAWLDDTGREEELPDGWDRPEDWDK